jgi:hypothetical protein
MQHPLQTYKIDIFSETGKDYVTWGRGGGYLPCRKYYKVWYSSKIKVNACILIHPINIYEFWGDLFKFTQFYFIVHFFPYTPSNQFFKLHIGYVGSVTFNLANLQSHPSKFI